MDICGHIVCLNCGDEYVDESLQTASTTFKLPIIEITSVQQVDGEQVSKKTKIEYCEHSLKDIIKYFVGGYSLSKDQKIIDVDYFIDSSKGKAIIKLIIEENYKNVWLIYAIFTN